MKRNIKKYFLAKTIIMLLSSFILGEITLRVYHCFDPIYIFYDNSYNRFRGKPFASDWDFKLNSKGFKDIEFTDKKEEVYRILGIGDSFTYGVVPYRYNYLTLLESLLKQENREVEILNMGIPSTGPKDYLSLFIREGLALNADLIILSFFIGNDFVDSDRTPKKRRLYSYSFVTSLLHYMFSIQPKYEGSIPHGKAVYCDDCPTFAHDTYLEIEKDRSFIYLEGNEYFIKLLDDALYYLVQIRDICNKKGIKLLIVIIPDELQINQILQTEIKNSFYPNLKKQGWNPTLPNSVLTEKLGELGIDYIDLYEYFAERAKTQLLYRPQDTHWNIAGNRLAADVIQDYVYKLIVNST